MHVAGVILAGGFSRRMGESKALLPYQGERLIDHMVQKLQGVLRLADREDPMVLISGQIEEYRCIADRLPAKGPLVGIYSVFQWFDAETPSHLLIVPVDMPLLSIPLLKTLTQVRTEKNAAAFRTFELPLLLRRSIEVERILEELCSEFTHPPLRSIRELKRRLSCHEVQVPAECNAEFLNANTPGEWLTVAR